MHHYIQISNQDKEQRLKESQQKKQLEEMLKMQEQKRREAEREQLRKYVVKHKMHFP